MNKNFLMVYDSESGSTREIAEMIAEKIGGDRSVVKSVNEKISIDNYDFVIVGSPNWYGKPTSKIAKFLKLNNGKLRRKKFAFFFTCMCLTQIEGKNKSHEIVFQDSQFEMKSIPEKNMNNWQKSHAASFYREQLDKITPGLTPLSVAVFKGRLDFSKLSFFHGLLMKMISLMISEVNRGDYINPKTVNAWAKNLKIELDDK